jgi:hypothetical protein
LAALWHGPGVQQLTLVIRDGYLEVYNPVWLIRVITGLEFRFPIRAVTFQAVRSGRGRTRIAIAGDSEGRNVELELGPPTEAWARLIWDALAAAGATPLGSPPQ